MSLDELERVNAEVNSSITFTNDVEQWKEDDRWEDGTETGFEDCDGITIAKLRKLLALGWPREDLKLGICVVETGDRHAVLIATVAGDDYVLDNRYPHVMEWKLLPYRWEKFYLFGERVWRAAAPASGR